MKIHEQLKSYLRPLNRFEFERLRDSIVAEGRALNPIICWDGYVVDGHHRLSICQELGLPYTVADKQFASVEDAQKWMRENNLAKGRGSSDGRGADCVWAVMHEHPWPSAGLAFDAKLAIEHGYADMILGGECTLAGAVQRIRNADRAARAARKPPTQRQAEAAAAARGVEVPPDMRLKGTSTLSGPDGKVKQQWDKTERASDDPPAHEVAPVDFAQRSVSTMLDGQGQVRVQWVSYEREKAQMMAAFEAAIREVVARGVTPLQAVRAPEFVSDEWLSLYPLGDPHIGLLGWAPETGEHSDLAIGVRDLETAISLAVDAAPAARRARLLNLGDYWHAQNDLQVTPGRGHKLDVDGRASKLLSQGLYLLERAVLRLLEKHELVDVTSISGNHDVDVSKMIPVYLEARFRDNPRVRISMDPAAVQMVEFGANMLVTCHGDRFKRERLPGVAATRWPEVWGRTRYRLGLTGHIHHITRQEYPGMVVESFRTIAGPDEYTHGSGFDSGRSLDVISLHRDRGPRMRTTIDISEVRAAQ